MPIYWWGNGAILLTKAARYIVPAVFAAAGAVVGYFTGKRRKREEGDLQ